MRAQKKYVLFSILAISLLLIPILALASAPADDDGATDADKKEGNAFTRFFRSIGRFFAKLFGFKTTDSDDKDADVADDDSIDADAAADPSAEDASSLKSVLVDIAIEDYAFKQYGETAYILTALYPFEVTVYVSNLGEEPAYPTVYAKLGWQEKTIEPGVVYSHTPTSATMYFDAMSEGDYELELTIDPLEGETNFDDNKYTIPLTISPWVWR